MKPLSIHEAKTHLSRLLHKVEKGEKVIFGERGKAQYQIVKVAAEKPDRAKAFGFWKGKVGGVDEAFTPEADAEIWADSWVEDIVGPEDQGA